LLKESLLRVLAIEDGSDNSLCLQASRSDSYAGYEAPLNGTTICRHTPSEHYSTSRPFSSFVVTAPVMLDSYPRSVFGLTVALRSQV